jgi:hypothetical protein
MKIKAILTLIVVFVVVNFIMGFVMDFIPSLGHSMFDWFVTAFVNAGIFLYVWKFLKGRF